MKKIALVVIVVASLYGCSKSKNNNVTPNSNDVVTMTIKFNADSSVALSLHYTDKNTGTYVGDFFEMYYNDTFHFSQAIPAQAANSDFSKTFNGSFDKYGGKTYKAFLIRNISSGVRDTMLTVTGS